MYGFSELEERLNSDKGAQVAMEALQKLMAIKEETERRIAEGLPQDAYEKAEKLLGALTAAHQILVLPYQTKD